MVAASDGNFSIALAYLCNNLKIKCYLFVPTVTLTNKVEKITKYGKEYIDLNLKGVDFLESYRFAEEFAI